MVGIVGYGVYIPKYRIKNEEITRVWGGGSPGISEKAIPYLDEDIVTMGVESAQNAIRHAGIDPTALKALYVGTTSSPYLHKSLAVLIAEVLGIKDDSVVADFSGSSRAGTTALSAGIDFVEAGHGPYGMVISTDFLSAAPGDVLEHNYGAGAASFILGREGIIAQIEGIQSFGTSFTGFWQNRGESFMRRYDDPRFEREYGYSKHIQEAFNRLLKSLGKEAKDFAHVIFHQQDGRLPPAISKSLRIPPAATAYSQIASKLGDTGCSSSLLGLAWALDQAKAGDRLMTVSYGSGAGSDAISSLILEDIEKKRGRLKPVNKFLEDKEYVDYFQYAKILGLWQGLPAPEAKSSFVTSPPMLREERDTLQLKGYQCKRCGSLNFPKTHFCVDCRFEEFEIVSLPRRGVIETFSIEHVIGIRPEFAPVVVCTAKLEGSKVERGGKLSGMLTECRPDEVAIGRGVELVFRKCGDELGLGKYGYKFSLIEQ